VWFRPVSGRYDSVEPDRQGGKPWSAIYPSGSQYGFVRSTTKQYVLEDSREVDGLILSGSGTLDRLALLVGSAPPGSNILNAPFAPARTPFDWLSRDNAVVDRFITTRCALPSFNPLRLHLFSPPRLNCRTRSVFAKFERTSPFISFQAVKIPLANSSKVSKRP